MHPELTTALVLQRQRDLTAQATAGREASTWVTASPARAASMVTAPV